ncbi:twin-arginine translocase TatA/TatE family subunit [Longirhabdus pacifica]|uniref:twin-arginine translocase TatA/TatE family subunit n=1 Tax=Longirhabdus pacifica TaxID=2305227 RepID=UPI0013E8D004|nr:twin-arginine translocase TatA/TatE family subunit [Longirhabdus pacifica]
MLGNIGITGIILILLIALLLFGPNKLPELGKAFGKTLREFKKGTQDIMSENEEDEKRERKHLDQSEVVTSNSSTEKKEDDNHRDRRLPE